MHSHPPESDLRSFWDERIVDADHLRALSRHLSECAQCRTRALAFPAPPLYILGRPQPPVYPVPPQEAERHLAELERRCLELRPSGGCVRLAAPWYAEAYLHHVLSVLAARLGRVGSPVSFQGSPRWRNTAPPPPPGGIGVLLEAPLLAPLEPWLKPSPGTVTILAGLDEDWAASGSAPDLSLQAADPSSAENLSAQYLDTVLQAYETGSRRVREALVEIARGNDVHASRFRPAAPPPLFRFVKQPLGPEPATVDGEVCYSIEGAWLAWHALPAPPSGRRTRDPHPQSRP
jgi:hypothetical protein